MLINKRLAFVLLAFLPLTSFSYSQQSESQADSGSISLDVVVTPKSGPPVSGLQQQDFTILDNKAPASITSFRALGGNEAPVRVILLVDAVNISYQGVAYERSQLDAFLKANGGKLAHPASLAVLTDDGLKIQPEFSTDGNALSAGLDQYVIGLRSNHRSSGFYGAEDRVRISINALGQLAEHEAGQPGRTMVLWMSPGWPLLSGPGVQISNRQQSQLYSEIVSFSTQLRKARVTLYSIDPGGPTENGTRTFYYQEFVKGVTKPSQVQLGNLGLQVIATQTGGLALNSSNDISGLLKQCLADADAYYELTFTPVPGEPNEYHHLEIKLEKPGLVARTRQGYYSRPTQIEP